MLHNVAQCRKEGCHRLLNDLLSCNVHEHLHHPEMTSGCVYVCVCVCLPKYFANCSESVSHECLNACRT